MHDTPPDRGELTLDDEGLLLYNAERELLEHARRPHNGPAPARPHLANALEALGRLRLQRVQELAHDEDRPAMDELRDRIRLAVERLTRRVLAEDDRLSLRTTHQLKDLVSSFTGLGGDLELDEPPVPGEEYAAQAGELAQAIAARHELEQQVDRLLDAIAVDRDDHARALVMDSPVLEDLRTAIGTLEMHRGRAA